MDFTNANCLIDSFRKANKASGWKESTQRYRLNLLKNTYELQNELRDMTYKCQDGSTFRICEQGHLRTVKAPTIRDSIVHHSVTNNILLPAFTPHMIHDSGASLKGKGMSFTRRRFEQHLSWHYRRYGTEGYVLKLDFRKYFDNIRHDILKKIINNFVSDEKSIHVIDEFLLHNRIDVSYSDDENIIDEVFSSLDYMQIDESLLTGERYMDKSLGIGSTISQAFGIFVPTPIDMYCKTVLGIHCYDAYMDDRIIIHHDKQFLKYVINEIERIAKELGLFIHKKKTQIVKLSHGFTFLKTRYSLTESGKITRNIPPDVIVRQRRKMKKLAIFVVNDDMTLGAFMSQYGSWRGDKKKYDNDGKLKNMDKLYEELITWMKKMKNR